MSKVIISSCISEHDLKEKWTLFGVHKKIFVTLITWFKDIWNILSPQGPTCSSCITLGLHSRKRICIAMKNFLIFSIIIYTQHIFNVYAYGSRAQISSSFLITGTSINRALGPYLMSMISTKFGWNLATCPKIKKTKKSQNEFFSPLDPTETFAPSRGLAYATLGLIMNKLYSSLLSIELTTLNIPQMHCCWS